MFLDPKGWADVLPRQIFNQLQTTLIQSERELRFVASQIQSKQRDKRMNELSVAELDAILPKNSEDMPAGEGGFYVGIGKMFVTSPNVSKVHIDDRLVLQVRSAA